MTIFCIIYYLNNQAIIGEIIMLNREGDMTGADINALRRNLAGNTAATVIAAHRPDTSDTILRTRWMQLSLEKYDCLYLTVKPHITVNTMRHIS